MPPLVIVWREVGVHLSYAVQRFELSGFGPPLLLQDSLPKPGPKSAPALKLACAGLP